ncbi:hypothetical protein D9M69_639500 [compost metagenome]
MAAPMELPAPGTLSMMTLAPPSGLRSASARSRATRSVGPPAAKGTTMVTGLPAGKSCAWAHTARATAARANIFFMEVSVKVKKKNQGAREGTRLSSVGGCHSGWMWQPFLPSVS